MAQANNASPNQGRPLSPHLAIWRWGPAMVVSILHRAAGNGLAFGGLALLLWWLGALAGGPEAYATFVHWVWTAEPGSTLQAITTVLGKLVLVGLSWAFFQHLSSGIRHFFLDVGAGYELEGNTRWSMVAMGSGVVMTALFWALLIAAHR